ELRHLAEVTVHCWGAPRDEAGVTSHEAWSALSEPKPESAALQAMSINLAMAGAVKGVDLVHSHTWYANLGGHLAKLTWSIPHVMTIHSLEPLRPWKVEQLGGGYALSLFCERTAVEAADAVIAVSHGVRKDVLDCYPAVQPERVHVIHNWIDHFISLEDLIHLHSDATVFVCPSIYEPFGLVILEAMACETAVVASRVGGIPEIVVEGETGFLVDYAPDAMDAFTSALAERI